MADKDIERAQRDIAQEAKRDAKRYEDQAAKLQKEFDAEQERAERERKHFEKTVKPKEMEEARQIRDHAEFLKANGLKHIRQPNEGPEDYSELPDSPHNVG